ncbi:methyltransferase, partial [Wenjunlia tyrosinilytica]|uniref:methyltransferase n=1 Tax=Wenjunlia tyrosinilytica TaxID=1544741 RepID=UPI0022486F26
PDRRRALIERAYEALDPGGTLLVYDRMIDDERGDLGRLLYSLNMMLVTPGGSEYASATGMEWLREAGFSGVFRQPLGPTHTLLMATR